METISRYLNYLRGTNNHDTQAPAIPASTAWAPVVSVFLALSGFAVVSGVIVLSLMSLYLPDKGDGLILHNNQDIRMLNMTFITELAANDTFTVGNLGSLATQINRRIGYTSEVLEVRDASFFPEISIIDGGRKKKRQANELSCKTTGKVVTQVGNNSLYLTMKTYTKWCPATQCKSEHCVQKCSKEMQQNIPNILGAATFSLDIASADGRCRAVRLLLCSLKPVPQDTYIQKSTEEHPPQRDPGSLVYAEVASKVSVNLDEFVEDPVTLARVVAVLKAKSSQFWIDRAVQQIWLTQFRFIFRPLYTDGKYQLPLTQPNHWNFVIHGDAIHDQSLDGHDSVYVNYTWSTYILSDYDSPGISEPNLSTIGGEWLEPFLLPADPYNILQRSGYACMDEGDFPVPSVHPEKTNWFYDDTCEAEDPFVYSPTKACRQCHCSHTVDISCVDAVKKYIGSVNVSFVFTRIPWNETLANRVRQMSDPPSTEHPDSADQRLLVANLKPNYLQYSYFTNDSCELREFCIGGAGWRRLLMFDSSDENIGGTTLTIGQIYTLKDDVTQLPDDVTNHGLYEYNICHRHYHFKYYGTFKYGDSKFQNAKRGFCIQSTGRQANAEWSPTWSPFYNCTYQGNSPGWTDTYQAGIPCQWIDITDYDTKESAITAPLSANMNPDAMLCEGQLILNEQGGLTWEATNYTAMNGQTVYRPKCKVGTNPSTLANNFDEVDITVPKDGHGYVTEPCDPPDQHIGSQRNCGFQLLSPMNNCTPDENARVQCSLKTTAEQKANAVPYVVRVCESSAVLQTGLACDHDTALKNMVVKPSSTIAISFSCPGFRDDDEPGGLYSIYTAPMMKELDDGYTTLECEAIG